MLEAVAGFMAVDQKAQEIEIHRSASLCHHVQQFRTHLQKLRHRGDVQHIGHDCNQHSGRGTQRGHGQVAQLRRAIENDDVVVVLDFLQGRCHPGKESGLHIVQQCLWGLVLELLQDQTGRGQINAGEKGFLDDAGQRQGVFVPNGILDRA